MSKSKYKQAQIEGLVNILMRYTYKVGSGAASEQIYKAGYRKLSIRFLTLHVLLSTWHWFFAGCFVFFLVGLFFFREEFEMNHWFILWIAIPLTAITAMILDSYRHAKRIMSK